MTHRKCSILILVTALLIIGMREVCMAQYSQQVCSKVDFGHKEAHKAQIVTQYFVVFVLP